MRIFRVNTVSKIYQLSMNFVLLINIKVLIFENSFLLNIAEHEKSFITSGPDVFKLSNENEIMKF